MNPLLPAELNELGGDEGAEGRSSAPELFHRRKVVQRVRKRAKRSRTTDMAKRGMHQRRNKRVAW